MTYIRQRLSTKNKKHPFGCVKEYRLKNKNTPVIGCAQKRYSKALRSSYRRRQIWHPINISCNHNNRLLLAGFAFVCTYSISLQKLFVNLVFINRWLTKKSQKRIFYPRSLKKENFYGILLTDNWKAWKFAEEQYQIRTEK